MKARAPITILLLTLGTLFAGCSADEGAIPGDSGNTVNEHTFSVEAFAYEDTQGESHHPLSGEITTLVEQAELAVLDPSGQGDGYILDPNDPDTAGFPSSTWVSPAELIDFAVGQIDEDPAEELLAITAEGVLVVLEPDGAWSAIHPVFALDEA